MTATLASPWSGITSLSPAVRRIIRPKKIWFDRVEPSQRFTFGGQHFGKLEKPERVRLPDGAEFEANAVEFLPGGLARAARLSPDDVVYPDQNDETEVSFEGKLLELSPSVTVFLGPSRTDKIEHIYEGYLRLI